MLLVSSIHHERIGCSDGSTIALFLTVVRNARIIESIPTAAHPGAKEDQQTGRHQVDQTCHLYISSSFLHATQLCQCLNVVESKPLLDLVKCRAPGSISPFNQQLDKNREVASIKTEETRLPLQQSPLGVQQRQCRLDYGIGKRLDVARAGLGPHSCH